MVKVISYAFTSESGWLRLFGYGIQYTRMPPLFSERNGYRMPFLELYGWRFFFLRGIK